MIINRKYAVIGIVVFVVALLAFSFYTQAMAYLPTPTPYTPPTVTPYPTDYKPNAFPITEGVDMSCPDGLPIGYGTLTPSANYNAFCSQCLPTPTIYPTYNFSVTLDPTQIWGTHFADLTQTAIPSTPTPTATGTPNPAVTGELFCSSTGNLSCEEVTTQHIRFTVPSTVYNPEHFYTYTGTSRINIRVEVLTDYGIFTVSPAGYMGDPGQPLSNNYLYPDLLYDVNAYGDRYWGVQEGVYQWDTAYTDDEFQVCPSSGGIYCGGNGIAYISAGQVVVDFFVGESPFETPTPTPTPYPTQSSYCAVIDDGGSSLSMPDLFRVASVAQCFSTPSFGLADVFGWVQTYLGWLVPDSITDFISSAWIPAQTFCFREVDFETVNILGVSISFSIFAILILGVYVLIHFTSK